MSQLRNILVATDFSAGAALAVERAAQLLDQIAGYTRRQRIDLTVVGAHGKGFAPGLFIGTTALKARNRVAAQMREQMRALVAAMPDRERVGSQIIRQGHAGRIIADTARELRADLIALGKRGLFEFDEGLLGSTAKHVLFALDRDVLLDCARPA